MVVHEMKKAALTALKLLKFIVRSHLYSKVA